MRSRFDRFSWVTVSFALVLALPTLAIAQTRGNPLCPGEDVFFNPGNGENIVVPPGFTVSVFKSNLNFPTAVAFRGNRDRFEVFVLESGHGLPSRCNDETSAVVGGQLSATNPFTPDILVFDQSGNRIRGPLAKPTASGVGLQPHGPAIDIAFENGFEGGRLFATDSNQAIRTVGAQNNSSRIVTVNPETGQVTPFITGLPTGDHPAEQITFKDGHIYWSQGSTTNSGVVGLDNGNGANQQDIPCQNIVLSANVFASSATVSTSGYSPHGVQRPGATVPAFDSATGPGICDGAILRAKVNAKNPKDTIEPFSWGYRNPYGIRFAPHDHALQGGLFVTENGEDERGARPTNNAPDRLQLAQLNRDGTPDHHGWPDRFGDLDSTQAVFNPKGGPGDDLQPAATVIAKDTPVRHVLAFFPQPPISPLAIEPADVAVVGPDFAPDSFARGVVKKGAALVAREGDFGFSPGNGEPEEGHDIQLVNFSRRGEPLTLSHSRFAFNCKAENQRHTPDGGAACTDPEDQAFAASTAKRIIHGINRPLQVQFGPDGALYLVDYGAVRDFGQSDPNSRFIGPKDGPLVQIPKTGVIWKIARTGARDDD